MGSDLAQVSGSEAVQLGGRRAQQRTALEYGLNRVRVVDRQLAQ